MRLLLYNIRYGTGGRRRPPWSGYLSRTDGNLAAIIRFVQSLDPDVVALVEVDAGTYRTNRRNQAQQIAAALGHCCTYRSKYGEAGVARQLPLLRSQGNALVTRNAVRNERFHYFDCGLKRLVIELELDEFAIFLVHLALTPRARRRQLRHLHDIISATDKPHVIAGDFNTRRGDDELRPFLGATGLINPDTRGQPSYPSWAPRRQLDFILHSRGIRVDRFWLPAVTHSDHLPLVCDFCIADE